MSFDIAPNYNSKNKDQPDKLIDIAKGAGISLLSNTTGITFANTINRKSNYITTPASNFTRNKIFEFTDFRAKLSENVGESILLSRKDGLTASFRSKRALLYSIASSAPGGAYTVFNLDAGGNKGFGWGSHDDPGADIYRKDFTIQSNVATKYSNANGWAAKILTQAVPFRGDRVNVIDYSKRTLSQTYRWKPSLFGSTKFLDNVLGGFNPAMTQDFIKFFFTGPKLHNGSKEADDIIVFRATLTNLDDQFSPSWNRVDMIGRADPNYHYSGFERSMQLGFNIYATDRDEVKPIWRKLNALAGYTAPTYDVNSIGIIGPWLRITVGDLLVQQPVIIESLSYTLNDDQTTWEINIEQDPEMKQVPIKISVTLQLKVITEYLPEKNGQFYTLSKNNDKYGTVNGTYNWLSDKDNPTTKRAAAQRTADGESPLLDTKDWF